tara:strand:+ start:419 stop:613 length:195 start_codon:yes stop_codon:yes gene_type:complete
MDAEVKDGQEEQDPHEPACDVAPIHGIITWWEPRLFTLIDEGIRRLKDITSRFNILAPEVRGGL